MTWFRFRPTAVRAHLEACLSAFLLAAALYPLQQGTSHEHPRGQKSRRHFGLAGGGAQRAADCACASPSTAATRRTRRARRAWPISLSAMLDEGAGDLQCQAVPGAHGGDRHAHGLRRRARCLLRQPRDADREPRQGR